MQGALGIRTATEDDAPAITAVVRAGFASYAEWAPEGWAPPDAGFAPRPVLRGGGSPGERCWVAAPEAGPAVGVVTLSTTSRAIPSVAPADVILRQLFVAPSHWGSGAAAALLGVALRSAREDGFEAMWLATPAGAGRARRFYARSGFAERGTRSDEGLGLDLVLMARALSRA